MLLILIIEPNWNRNGLREAAILGEVETVRALLDGGEAADATDAKGRTALGMAVGVSQTEVVRLLLNRGADMNRQTSIQLGITPLMTAATSGHAEMVRLLIERGADVTARNWLGLSITRMAANHPEVLELLQKAEEGRRGDADDTASLTEKLFVCPDDSDPHGGSLGTACTSTAPAPGVTSYLVNAYFLFGLADSQLAGTANTIYVVERNGKFCNVHIHPWLGEVYDWAGKTGVVEGNTLDNAPYVSSDNLFAVASKRHTQGSNYAFADGHVKWERYAATIQPTTDQPYYGQYQAPSDVPRATP